MVYIPARQPSGGTPAKKIVPVPTASALAVSLMAATAGAKRTAGPPTLKPDTLIVGLTPPASGFQDGTTQGHDGRQSEGTEIDLAKAIAAKLGLQKIAGTTNAVRAVVRAGPGPYDFSTPARRRSRGALEERRLLDPVHQRG